MEHWEIMREITHSDVAAAVTGRTSQDADRWRDQKAQEDRLRKKEKPDGKKSA